MKLDSFEPYDILIPGEGSSDSIVDYDDSYDSYEDGSSYTKYVIAAL